MKLSLIVLFFIAITSNSYADENNFSNANLQGYLNSHNGSVSVIDSTQAVTEEKQLATENKVAPQTTTIIKQPINRTTIINNDNNNGYGYNDGAYYADYAGGYYGYGGYYSSGNYGGYSGYSPSLLRSDEMHGRAVLNAAHFGGAHYSHY